MITHEQRWLRDEIRHYENAIERITETAEDPHLGASGIAIRRISRRVEFIRRVLAIVERAQREAAA